VWEPGGDPPWRTSAGSERLAAAAVAIAIAARGVSRAAIPTPVGSRRSAVLVAIADGHDGAEVLLTRRTMELSSHRGEISFPGGRVDGDETDEDAALREAHEEVALAPTSVRIVGTLAPLSTLVSRSFIVPVVGIVDGRPALHPAAAEVDRIMWVPFADLLRADTYRAERWMRTDEMWDMHFFHLDDETVWGATARMLHELLLVVHGETTGD